MPFAVVVGGAHVLPAFAEVTGDGLVDLLVLRDDGTIDAFANTGIPATPFGATASITNLLGTAVPNATETWSCCRSHHHREYRCRSMRKFVASLRKLLAM